MARNLDILVGLVAQGWERGAFSAEEVVRTLQRVELEPNVATGVQSAETFDAGPVPPAATADALDQQWRRYQVEPVYEADKPAKPE